MRTQIQFPARLAASLLIAGWLLAGCTQSPGAGRGTPGSLTPADPEPEAAAQSAPASTVPGEAPVPAEFAGRWFVSAVYPTGARAASKADPHIGASLVITPAEASDVNGQRCIAPAFHADRSGPEAGTLGNVDLTALQRLRVDCKGTAFASYLLLPGRRLAAAADASMDAEVPHSLLAARPEAHYLLERAEQILLRQAGMQTASAPEISPPLPAAKPGLVIAPQPVADTTPAPATSPATLKAPLILAPEPPVPATVAESTAAAPSPSGASSVSSTLPAPGSAIHLASYAGISAARRGWKILLGEFDVLDPMAPLYVKVDVPGKGPMVRLYATGGDRAALDKACTALHARAAYCEVSR